MQQDDTWNKLHCTFVYLKYYHTYGFEKASLIFKQRECFLHGMCVLFIDFLAINPYSPQENVLYV